MSYDECNIFDEIPEDIDTSILDKADEIEACLLDNSALSAIAWQAKQKHRERVRSEKKFDAKIFYDCVVSNIESKYGGKSSYEIDLKNLQVVNDGDEEDSFLKRQKTTKFGDFSKQFDKALDESYVTPGERSLVSYRSSNSTAKLSPKKPAAQHIVEYTVEAEFHKANNGEDSGDEETIRQMFGSMIASRPDCPFTFASSRAEAKLQKQRMERSCCLDLDFQKRCLRNTLDALCASNQMVRHSLHQKALQTLRFPLRNSHLLYPILRFDRKQRPHFEFHLLAATSPISIYESTLHIDGEIVQLSKTIFDFLLAE